MRVFLGALYALLLVGLGFGGLWTWQKFMAQSEPATEQPAAGSSAKAGGEAATPEAGCEILYYRNPMGLPDISYEPKKDSMGMDYLPVCKEETASGFAISPERQQSLGVTFVTVERTDLLRTIEAVGLVEMNERTQSVIAPRVEGWIEELLVDATGDHVTKGMAVARVFAPDLIQAQVNYRQAVQDGVARARGAAERLKLLGLSEADIDRLGKGGDVAQTTLLVAPQDGIVIRKMATDGMFFSAGQTLLEIADLSRVWVVGDIYERDLALVTPGAPVEVIADAYPGRRFAGTVDSVLPEIMQDTRTARVRIELDNAEGLLKPGLFVRIRLHVVAAAAALVVPRSAILDGGRRQVALVALDQGHFEARDLRLGQLASGKVEVVEGLAEGERVVESAAFLIDAESNIRAALQAFEPAPTIDGEGAKP